MINKQNLWFVTLFSLILVLGIYYVTMGDETLSVLAGENNVSSPVEVKASDVIVALQVASDESVLKEMKIAIISSIHSFNESYKISKSIEEFENSKEFEDFFDTLEIRK